MRIGIDLGGTKIEGILLDNTGYPVWRQRVDTPAHSYAEVLETIDGLVEQMCRAHNLPKRIPIGIGTPGSMNAQGVMKNCNSVMLNGMPLQQDLEKTLGRPVRIANDANCFALSEALEGAGSGMQTVFGVILGTGVGGGIVVGGKLMQGPNGIAGEWGHNPMPGLGAQFPDERRTCYCGRINCVETYLCGKGLALSYARRTGNRLSAEQVVQRAAAGDPDACATLHQYQLQLACALAHVVNILDPEVVVLGGGLSNIESIYNTVPELWPPYVFSDTIATRLVRAQRGDSSGVFGAAWLWGRQA